MALYTIAAFYKFTELTEIDSLKSQLELFCEEHHILGTLIIAKEGINSTVAGEEKSINALIRLLQTDSRLSGLDCKYSVSEINPFNKMKVLIKKEIVTFNPNLNAMQKMGIHVSPDEWNQLMSDPEMFVIDTRNTYEIELGAFQGAINPKTESFSEFPAFVENNLDPNKHKKIAMYCTGGIRCEKASAYLLEQGFENVYQLEGGILKYLEKMDPIRSLWEGKCFIFDNRVTLDRTEMINVG